MHSLPAAPCPMQNLMSLLRKRMLLSLKLQILVNLLACLVIIIIISIVIIITIIIIVVIITGMHDPLLGSVLPLLYLPASQSSGLLYGSTSCSIVTLSPRFLGQDMLLGHAWSCNTE